MDIEHFVYENKTEHACAMAQKILANPWFLAQHASIIFLDIIGLILMALFFLLLFRNRRLRALHPNIRALFLNITFLIAFRTTWTLMRSASNIYLHVRARVSNPPIENGIITAEVIELTSR
ncbi:hypothetical protein QR680_001044 [Steinernema hermaphroditum]|uniref:Uncharacterized protein n=1 Tax=Steinernema hermaphroditum TaxID=289476 RepID=A0AA39LF94_9BILA|nr:hypothetical protein QR680_001044 [Steinernema hermaphroditum]